MTFSIVISTYNRLDLLKRAIASALNQTVPCEVVVADDASTDGTEAYLHSLGDQVVYHRNGQNLNHAGTVNAGVAAASGDWVKLLDDDDYLAPNCIEAMDQAIACHPQAVICSCQAAQVDINGAELRRTATPGPGVMFYIPQSAIHYGMLLDRVPFGTPVQVAFHRQAFLKTGGWDTTMTTNYDDIDAWIRLAEHGDALFLNQCLAYRTVWPGGHEQKMSLQNRLALNITIKQRIHQRVGPTYQTQCPSMQDLSDYLHLHWGLVALRQKQLGAALPMILPAVLNRAAWRLLYQARQLRSSPAAGELIPKQVIG
ncbi:glycosyl transferase [filamentous cyanobacterium CCP5]|nr:glycosyl transferase [filamentous cyanobacterium CCP5]